MYVNNGTGVLKRVLVSKPKFLKPAPINEIAKLWKDTTLDVDKMLEEHENFTNTYKKLGIEVEYLEAKESRPNSVLFLDELNRATKNVRGTLLKLIGERIIPDGNEPDGFKHLTNMI